MAARIVEAWGLPLPDNRPQDFDPYTPFYAHCGCFAEGDTPEEAVAEARKWIWEAAGGKAVYIRTNPQGVSETDFDTKITRHGAHARISIEIGEPKTVGFGRAA